MLIDAIGDQPRGGPRAVTFESRAHLWPRRSTMRWSAATPVGASGSEDGGSVNAGRRSSRADPSRRSIAVGAARDFGCFNCAVAGSSARDASTLVQAPASMAIVVMSRTIHRTVIEYWGQHPCGQLEMNEQPFGAGYFTTMLPWSMSMPQPYTISVAESISTGTSTG